MAERKSGPVKPPVVELTARQVETPEAARKAAPGASKAADKPAPPSPPPPEQPAAVPPREPARKPPEAAAPPARRSRSSGLILAGLGGAVGGAILGIAACYGLAYQGLWPGAANAEPRFAAMEQRLAQADSANAATGTALADADKRLGALDTAVNAKLGATTAAVAALQQRVDKLPAAAVDVAPLEAQLKTLASRVDAVAAGASSADAGALAANIATLQQNFMVLSQKFAALGDRTGATDAAVAALKTELDAAKAAIDKAAAAPSAKSIATAMQLPLLISALEADLTAGRPYDADLKSLRAALPEARVPASVTDAAGTGLPAAQQLVDAFEAKMPDIMAARPARTDAGWQAEAGDWLKNLLALRQQGEQAGDTPDAVLSRVEGAVNRHDFAGAAKLLAQLPQPMQAAAGPVATQIGALAEAQAFIAELRQTALAPAQGAAQ